MPHAVAPDAPTAHQLRAILAIVKDMGDGDAAAPPLAQEQEAWRLRNLYAHGGWDAVIDHFSSRKPDMSGAAFGALVEMYLRSARVKR